ncbi:hypothetical protein ACFS4T_20260 [Pseudomonas lini]
MEQARLAGRQIKKTCNNWWGERLLHLGHEHWCGFNWLVVDWSIWLNPHVYSIHCALSPVT